MRRGTRFCRDAIAALALAALAALSLSGCQDILNNLLDNAAPAGLSASDGDYANSIAVSWSAPSLSSEKWKDYTIDHYEVRWSWASGSGYDYNVYATSMTIFAVPIGVEYDVTVTTILRSPSGGTETGAYASDTGFAMDASPLLWYDGGADYSAASGGSWYVTMLQKGFTYSFNFGAGNNGSAEFYPYRSLDYISGTSLGSAVSWTCDSDGAGHKFYVKVNKSAADSFRATCDYGY